MGGDISRDVSVCLPGKRRAFCRGMQAEQAEKGSRLQRHQVCFSFRFQSVGRLGCSVNAHVSLVLRGIWRSLFSESVAADFETVPGNSLLQR